MSELVGRSEELAILQKLYKSNASGFVAVYGRRRVGKTFLIRNAFNNQFAFTLTGAANSPTAYQLANFQTALIKASKKTVEPAPATNWQNAFKQLITLLEADKSAKKVVFLDELPWLDTAQSGFIPGLEHFWNAWASARKDILLVVCGSAAAWMIGHLINATGGLHNRVTHRIRLQPFTLHECELFFQARKTVFDRYQILLLYMVMGGIPFYLDQVDESLSAAQNINRLCFEKDGALRSEFHNLYRSLFNKAGKHVAVIETLSKKAKGLTRNEIIKGAKLPDAGSTTRILNELEESDFIRRYAPYGNKGRNSLYQLTDCYSLFYLKWINKSSSFDENTWINQLDSPAYRAWSGYAFEQACLSHIRQIKQALGISGVQTVTSSWISRNSEHGAQIDLVIDRRDQVINICEMKFSIDDFTIDKKYAETLKNKIKIFREETSTRKAIFLTMVTTFGISKNSYASIAQHDFTMEIMFQP